MIRPRHRTSQWGFSLAWTLLCPDAPDTPPSPPARAIAAVTARPRIDLQQRDPPPKGLMGRSVGQRGSYDHDARPLPLRPNAAPHPPDTWGRGPRSLGWAPPSCDSAEMRCARVGCCGGAGRWCCRSTAGSGGAAYVSDRAIHGPSDMARASDVLRSEPEGRALPRIYKYPGSSGLRF